MTYMQRLMDCGFTAASAAQVCGKYAAKDDFKGLRELVQFAEAVYREVRK